MAVLMVGTGLAFGPGGRRSAPCWSWPPSARSTPPRVTSAPSCPIEQALLPDTVPTARRTHVFARYSLVASLAGGLRRPGGGRPGLAGRAHGGSPSSTPSGACSSSTRWRGWCLLLAYRRLAPAAARGRDGVARSGLGRSKAIVLRLSALFSVDAFGGGFAVQSILVLWLSLRFGLSTAPVGRGVLLERPAHGQLGAARARASPGGSG